MAQLLEQLHSLDGRIATFGQQIDDRSQPLGNSTQRLIAIPGVDKITASALIAEIGADMTQFPTARHLPSWAGICPGNNESAGKSYSGKTRAALGDKDQAFEWLQKAYDDRSTWLIYLKVDPTFNPLRSDPRFTDLVRRMGLPP